MGRRRFGLAASEQEQVTGYCVYGDELASSVKRGEYLD
jgi:hypothetical protein